MNQLENARTLDVVAAEINAFTAAALGNIIEIGRRMCEAKAMLPHGEFGGWIEKHTGYSTSTANNFMRIFNEFGTAQTTLFAENSNCQTFGNLSYTKALALLSVPAEERETFAKEHDVESMSTRELKEAIRARDAAIKRAADAEKEAGAAADELIKMEREIKELRNRPVEVMVKEPDPAEVKKQIDAARMELEKKHREAIKKVTADLKAEREKSQELAAELMEIKEAVETADPEAVERLQRELDETRKQLLMSDAAVTTFKLHFSAWQSDFSKIKASLSDMPAETVEKLTGAMKAQLEAWVIEIGGEKD